MLLHSAVDAAVHEYSIPIPMHLAMYHEAALGQALNECVRGNIVFCIRHTYDDTSQTGDRRHDKEIACPMELHQE
jgi:hypothetical protein